MAAKRRSPARRPDEDDADAKRARHSSEYRSNESGVTMGVATIRPPVSASSASLISAVVTIKLPSTSSSDISFTPSNNGDSSSGGNAFLKSTRKAISSKGSTIQSTSIDDVLCSVPTSSIKSPKDKSTTTTSKVSSMILFFLFVANLIAITYITSQQTWQSLIHMKRETELHKLRNELAVSQNEVSILQVQLETLEKIWLTNDNNEEFDGVLGPARLSNNPADRLSVDKRNTWMEKIRILESEKEYVLNEFRKNLSVSQELVKALKQCQNQDGR